MEQKKQKTLVGLVVLLGLCVGLFNTAHAGYWKNSDGTVWKNPYGECWQDRWAKDEMLPECGDMVEKEVLDSDGDGVPDDQDRCPGTPRGVSVDSVGCPLDSDGDGVTDDKDRCPGTPRGVKVDMHGCELDSDGDGVVDSKDQCPGTPPGVEVNALGCSKPLVLKGVNFKHDSAQLTAEAKTILNGVADKLRGHRGIKVEVAGHTDSQGTDAYNMGLSQRRAQSVVDYLTSKGVYASDLTAKGYGEGRPLTSNSTAEGRAQNRRVELNTPK